MDSVDRSTQQRAERRPVSAHVIHSLGVAACMLGSSVLWVCGLATACTSSDAPIADTEVNGHASALVSAARAKPAPAGPGYFIARRDLRRCVAPICGGFFVSLVNKATTPCVDGSAQAECYVAELDLSGLGLSPDDEAALQGAIGINTSEASVVLVGQIQPKAFGSVGTFGQFVARSAWRAAKPVTLSGTFYGLKDSGIVCITYPCPSIAEAKLNTSQVQNIHGVDFTQAPGSDADKDAAGNAIFSGEGLVATGTNSVIRRAGPAGAATVLNISQYFRLVTPSAAPLQWFSTCGDPVCRGWSGQSGLPLCTTQAEGQACDSTGDGCDPKSDCNSVLVCADHDPKQSGCPISSRRFKTEIHYLESAELAELAQSVDQIRLASYVYKSDPHAVRQLGFIVEDNAGTPAVQLERSRVDLYGYTSMAVAAVQTQNKRVAALESEIGALRAELALVRESAESCQQP